MNPRNRGRAITLTFDQFKYGWTNALDEDEAKRLYDTYHVAGSGFALAQMGNANLNPWTESKVDTKNPDRGPLLILEGKTDHTVPWAIANASYKRQKRNPSVTEIKKMPNRGHSLTIDHGWQEVAQTALDFVERFVPAGRASQFRSGWQAESPPRYAPRRLPGQSMAGWVSRTRLGRTAPAKAQPAPGTLYGTCRACPKRLWSLVDD